MSHEMCTREMNLDETCVSNCVELRYMCDILGVLSCDTRCPTSASQSTDLAYGFILVPFPHASYNLDEMHMS